MTSVILAYDATSRNEPVLPTNVLAAGYDTQAGGGTGFIAWTAEQYARHTQPYPAIHIDQDANASDPLADILDVEAGAATDTEIVNWITRARDDYKTNRRPGQRWPGIYCSVSNQASAVAVLHAANIVDVPFWLADYSVDSAEATRRVASPLQPYPVIGFQFSDQAFGGAADASEFSLSWVQTMSGAQPAMEDDMSIGQMISQAYIPLPPGKYTKLYLWRDFQSVSVRVAVLKAGKFAITVETITPQNVHPVDITGVEAVSLNLKTGTGPIGYAFA